MNIRIFYKQTSQYNRCRPTVVDRCPTAVDNSFVAQKALSTAFIPSDYYSHLMPSCMHDAACTGHVNADNGY